MTGMNGICGSPSTVGDYNLKNASRRMNACTVHPLVVFIMFVKTSESASRIVTHAHVVRYNDTDKTGIDVPDG